MPSLWAVVPSLSFAPVRVPIERVSRGSEVGTLHLALGVLRLLGGYRFCGEPLIRPDSDSIAMATVADGIDLVCAFVSGPRTAHSELQSLSRRRSRSGLLLVVP